MPRVTVTAYEYDLVPMVCARCGAPADTRVVRKARYFGEEAGALPVLAVMVGFFLVPPLFLGVATRFGSVIEVPVPTCATHRGHWRWLDRATYWLVLPLWTLSVFVFELIGVMYMVKGDGDNSAAAFAAVICCMAVAITVGSVINLGSVVVAKPGPGTDARLSGVHPDFVAALIEDRARQRVDDPDRRPRPRLGARDDDEVS